MMPAMTRASVLLPPAVGAGDRYEALAYGQIDVVEYFLGAALILGGIGYVLKFQHGIIPL